MKPKLLTVLVVVLLVAAGLWLAPPGKEAAEGELAGEVALSLPGEQRIVQVDKIPPDFFIIKNDQQALALSEIKDKYVFINFWNTWCPPCRAEMPDLNKLYLEYGGKNVEFIFINIAGQEKSLADVKSFLAENNYSIPVYLDRQGEVARAYGIRGIPTTVVINPAGELVYAASGQINYEQARSLITE